jgi:hypothetical protein
MRATGQKLLRELARTAASGNSEVCTLPLSPGYFGRSLKLSLDDGGETRFTGQRRAADDHGAGYRNDSCDEKHPLTHD